MEWQVAQFSVVVVGEAHNPSILNPDFLANQGIVPRSWGWEVEEALTTPPLSMVRYKNGISLTVEHNKIQVTDPNVEDGPEQSKISEIATAYVKTLPHVHYTAVGINFQSVAPMQSTCDYLKTRFLNNGDWIKSEHPIDSIGIKLRYPLLPTGQLTLAIDEAKAKLPGKDDHNEVIVCNANFNRECGKQPAADQAIEYLHVAMNDWKTYTETLGSLFESNTGASK